MYKFLLTLLLTPTVMMTLAQGGEIMWPQYEENPFVIRMDIPAPEDSRGGVVSADVNGDGLMDFLVTVPDHIAAYDHFGGKLWIKKVDVRISGQSERQGLPGHFAPGLQAGDCDGDGKCEVLFLTQYGTLHIVEGSTGKETRTLTFPRLFREGMAWQHLILCNLRGQGDRDIILQTTNEEGYRMGRFVAAFSLEEPQKSLWQVDDFVGCAHNGARVADIDSYGRDEILGATVLDHDGRLMVKAADFRGHMDSVYAYKVRPDIEGLQVVLLEEGSDNVQLLSKDQVLWRQHYQEQEPQNAAVGDFDLSRAGLEVWCRSRYNTHQKPFVFDAYGNLIAHWEMDDAAPQGWTDRGVETIGVIDWTGEKKQLAAAKERHRSGDICVFDPVTGKFIEHFKEAADRLYVADISGDWREEIIVLAGPSGRVAKATRPPACLRQIGAGSELHIYHNPAKNPRPDNPRLWGKSHYRRSKMTYNYYSP